jgi:hypothetical protein
MKFLLLAVILPLGSPEPGPPSPADTGAYVDARARELVAAARRHRAATDSSIVRYQVLAQERLSVGVRALLRERLLFRREVAAQIDWRRDGPTHVAITGARHVVPVASARPRATRDGAIAHLVFDPAGDRLFVGPSGTGDDVRHPLAEGSEADYRFRSGGTTVITLADGRRITLQELQLLPRRSDYRLLTGSLWLDSESHGVVQAVFRMARPFDLERDGDEEDGEDVPRVLRPLLFPLRAELNLLTIDYGLWDMRWWLPRTMIVEGRAEVGSLGRVPLRYERRYSGYEVTGPEAPGLEAIPTEAIRDSAQIKRICGGTHDVLLVQPGAPPPEGAVRCHCSDGVCRGVYFTRSDRETLLTSIDLPPSIYQEGVALIDAAEFEELLRLVERAAPAPWQLEPPRFLWGLDRSGLLRYNRVEGLSAGVRGELELGRLAADLTLRLGVADLEPGAELGIEQAALRRRIRVAGYRRLDAIPQGGNPFGLANSLGAVLFGRDDGDYVRAGGVEVLGEPAAPAARFSATWRLFAERQWAAQNRTDLSLPHLLNDERSFRPALPAVRADQAGAEVTFRSARGLNPAGFRAAAEATVLGSTGDFDFLKPSVALRLGVPLGRYASALELAGGTTSGAAPPQALWYLGGPGTLRGYPPASLRGPTFARARAEVGTALPAARLALFSDAGWAGQASDFAAASALVSAGVGASLLDGLVRFDLARGLREPRRWRFDLYLDGAL